MIFLSRILFKNKKISKFVKKSKGFFIVCLLAFVFFVGTSSFYYFTQNDDFQKWTSPDETANYIFTRLYAQTGSLTITEKYNLETEGIMHPRSFRVDGDQLKPVSFLGIILIFGEIAKLTSYKVIPFLTPFFGALAIIFFYLLIKKLFGKNNALISVFIMASFPPFVYYTARSMFHNVLFVSLLIISLYFMIGMSGKIKKQKFLKSFKVDVKRQLQTVKDLLPYWIAACFAGFFLGLSIITRTSELLWLGPGIFIVFIFNIRKLDLPRILFFVLFLILAMWPAMQFNQKLYGSYFFGGYTEMNRSIESISNAGTDIIKSGVRGDFYYFKDLLNIIKDNVFYFGFSPGHSLKMLDYYFIKMFPYLFWGAVAGFVLFFLQKKKWKMKYITYVLFMVSISAILVLYYGSWVFHDNPDPNSYTIGNSYTRYWLPVYFGAIPFFSFLIMRLTMSFVQAVSATAKRFADRCIKKRTRNFYLYSFRVVIVGLICLFYIQFVIIRSDDGLLYLGLRHIEIRDSVERVLDLTEHNSAIITFYHDKMFFPERKVIVGRFDDKKMIAQYKKLVEYLPVYYYNFSLPQKDIDYLNARRLGEVGLGIEKVQKITKDLTLYKLFKSDLQSLSVSLSE